jgi:DNA-directed RNA polymerase subunit RPC12/RpoP
MDREVSLQSYMEENLECCLKCGKRVGLQGVAVTVGRRTFHLFYLCTKCGNVNIEELLKIIGSHKEKRTTL